MLTYNKCKVIQNIDSSSGRVYDTPEGKFPSVTTVLSATANSPILEAWKAKVGHEEAERIKKEAAARGTIMHSYLEMVYEKNQSPTIQEIRDILANSNFHSEPLFIQTMIKSILKYLVANNFVSLAQEIALWDSDLKIAGRCDGIGYWNGVLCLVDYKSARKEKKVGHIRDYYLQATAYCKAHNQLFENKINNFAIIMANEQGGSQLFLGKPAFYIPELTRRVKQFYEQKKA